jgi:very-short-patch-repair endonuclease
METTFIHQLTETFEAHAQQTETGVEYWLARDLQPLLGYSKWENFHHLIKRAQHLLIHKHLPGSIEATTRVASIGSGAIRKISDYRLDHKALSLVAELATSYKLTNKFSIRNESVVMQLLEKYCRSKKLAFAYQYRLGGFVFDCMIGHRVLIEFDEPHHQECGRQSARDATKDYLASSSGFKVLRVDLESDIIDLILAVQIWELDIIPQAPLDESGNELSLDCSPRPQP